MLIFTHPLVGIPEGIVQILRKVWAKKKKKKKLMKMAQNSGTGAPQDVVHGQNLRQTAHCGNILGMKRLRP